MTANAARDSLFSYLAKLGIATTTVPYPAHASVEEGRARRGDLPGRFTKNLLLRDKKHHLYLIVAGEDQVLDLKTFHRLIGARGRLSFADPAEMKTLLGVEPGALTPLGLIHDDRCVVRVVLDESLLEADVVNFHPLVNTESTSLKPHDLVRFIRATGREPLLVRLSGPMSVGDDRRTDSDTSDGGRVTH